MVKNVVVLPLKSDSHPNWSCMTNIAIDYPHVKFSIFLIISE